MQHGSAAIEKSDQFGHSQSPQDIGARAAEQSAHHLKRRIFGGGTDERDVAALDVWQKSILLSLVEAVDFVDEDDRAAAHCAVAFGIHHDGLDFFDAAHDGAEGDEIRFGGFGDEAGQSGFADARRTP